jgi:hypothetical protein
VSDDIPSDVAKVLAKMRGIENRLTGLVLKANPTFSPEVVKRVVRKLLLEDKEGPR